MVYPPLPEMPPSACRDAVFCIQGTADAVRAALRDIVSHPVLASLSQTLRGNAELVLAEVMNNIVEHAYCRQPGQIFLHIRLENGAPFFEVIDDGGLTPNEEIPKGLAPQIDKDHELPEGGFGWFLIRTLTQDLSYRRVNARNHLNFLLNLEQ